MEQQLITIAKKFIRLVLGSNMMKEYYSNLLPFYNTLCSNFYNTEWRQYHGMEVNYYCKKAYNIGPGLNGINKCCVRKIWNDWKKVFWQKSKNVHWDVFNVIDHNICFLHWIVLNEEFMRLRSRLHGLNAVAKTLAIAMEDKRIG